MLKEKQTSGSHKGKRSWTDYNERRPLIGISLGDLIARAASLVRVVVCGPLQKSSSSTGSRKSRGKAQVAFVDTNQASNKLKRLPLKPLKQQQH